MNSERFEIWVCCPNCTQQMKYSSCDKTLKKRKKCVYCGKTFVVRDAIIPKNVKDSDEFPIEFI
jgi:uncharacterized protein (DUF983 family)